MRHRYRCAVVVFADCLGVDQDDANSGLEIAIRAALGGPRRPQHFTLTDQFGGPINVQKTMPLGMVFGNYYAGVNVLGRAWRDYGSPDPGPYGTLEETDEMATDGAITGGDDAEVPPSNTPDVLDAADSSGEADRADAAGADDPPRR